MPSTPPNTLTYPADGDEICRRLFGFLPKPEQREVVELIGHGKDCILIAGCSWGKTLVASLSLTLWKSRVIVIISPLVALMDEQEAKFLESNISSIAIHGQRKLPVNLEDALMNGEFQAVFMSPEAVFDNKHVAKLWNEEEWRSRVQAIVVDEAHCISTWGTEFRTAYSKIGELRSSVPPHTAFVAMSATLHGKILEDVRTSLQFSGDVKVIRGDTDRPNVHYALEVTSGDIRTCYKALEAFLDSKKTIVYFDSLTEMQDAYRHLAGRIREPNSAFEVGRSQIVMYYADLSPAAKYVFMKWFKEGKIRVLLSTDAAGMGCDIRDIFRVVQFRFPKCISVLAQRLGRAARDPKLQGTGILLYPRSDAKNFKTMDPLLYGFITAKCRREHFNSVFENPHKRVDNCCDLCDANTSIPQPASPSTSLNKPDYRMVRTSPRPDFSHPFNIQRRPEQRLVAKEKIENWRKAEFQELKKRGPFYTEKTVMSDATINKITQKFGNIKVVQDIDAITPWSEPLRGATQRLVDILVAYNNEIDSSQHRQGIHPPKRGGESGHTTSEDYSKRPRPY